MVSVLADVERGPEFDPGQGQLSFPQANHYASRYVLRWIPSIGWERKNSVMKAVAL